MSIKITDDTDYEYRTGPFVYVKSGISVRLKKAISNFDH